MKAVSSSSAILALTALTVGFLDTLAFSPAGRYSRTKPSSTSQTIAFWIGNNKKPSQRCEEMTLHVAEESAAAAQAAFMSAAPLLLAPLAALAYGSQALNAKEQLELDLVATEIRLEDIKEKTRRTQLQATSSFALALASAGLVVVNTFGDIATRPGTNSNTFFDQMEKTEVLSPSQESSTSKLLEKMESGASTYSPIVAMPEAPPASYVEKEQKQSEADRSSEVQVEVEENPSSTSEVIGAPGIDEPKQSGGTSGLGDESKAMIVERKWAQDLIIPDTTLGETSADIKDSVEGSLEKLTNKLNELVTKESALAEASKKESATQISPPQNELDPMIAFPDTQREEATEEPYVTEELSDTRAIDDISNTAKLPTTMGMEDIADKDPETDSVMSKLEAAWKAFLPSKDETLELRPNEPSTDEAIVTLEETSATQPNVKVESTTNEASAEPRSVDDSQVEKLMLRLDQAIALPQIDTPGVQRIESQVDNLVSKLDDAISNIKPKSGPDDVSNDVQLPTAMPSPSEENKATDKILNSDYNSQVDNLMSPADAETTMKDVVEKDPQADTVMSKLEAAWKAFLPSKTENVGLQPIESIPAEAVLKEDVNPATGLATPPSAALELSITEDVGKPTSGDDSQVDKLMSKLDKAVSKATGAERIDSQVDNVMSKLDEAMSKFKPATTLDSTDIDEDVSSTVSSQMEGGKARDESPGADERLGSFIGVDTDSPTPAEKTYEPANTESILEKLITKLEAAMDEKEVDNTAPASSGSEASDEVPTSELIVPADEMVSSEGSSSVTEDKFSGEPETMISKETAQDDSAILEDLKTATISSDGVPTMEKVEIVEDSVSQGAPVALVEDAPAVTKQPSPVTKEEELTEETAPAVTEEQPTAMNEQKAPEESFTSKEDALVVKDEDLPFEAVPAATIEETRPETTLSPAKEEAFAPVLSELQTPSAALEIRIPGLESMDPAVYQSAAAIAAGAVLVGILASVGDDTATMPVGKKEEKTSYLDGLTRSSTTSSGPKLDKPSGYLDTLKSPSAEVPKSGSGKGPSALGTGSYLENLSSSKSPRPGYGLPNTATNGSYPVETKATNARPLSVTNASQYKAEPRPAEDPRASIPKSQFSPATEKARPVTTPPVATTPKEVSRQRVPEPPKAVPGLSYLESMSQRVPPELPKTVPGRSYLESVSQRGPPEPPRTVPGVPGRSYLETMSQQKRLPPEPAKAIPVVPARSFVENIAQDSSGPRKVPQPVQKNNISNVGKIEPPKAVPGLSYLDRMSQAKAPNGYTQPSVNSFGTGPPNGSSFGTGTGQPYSNGRAVASNPPPFRSFPDGISKLETATPTGAGPNGESRAKPPFQSFADSLSRPNASAPLVPSSVVSSGSPSLQSFSDRLSGPNGQQPTYATAITTEDRMTQTNVGSIADKPKPKAPAGFGSYLDSL